MNQYTDLKVIECNRLHSEEAKSGNNENFALWTNNLQDIVHLDAGDKVSVHGAMISERGAGQSSSIEIKGQSLGFSKDFTFTKIQPANVDDNPERQDGFIAGFDLITATEKTETKEIRDDTGYFLMSYYIPANGHNYIDLPRRHWTEHQSGDGADLDDWNLHDSLSEGMSLYDPFNKSEHQNDVDKYNIYDEFYQIFTNNLLEKQSKLKKDNSRYTIMMADITLFSETGASEFVDIFPPEYLREPEYMNYLVVRELKEINAPAGFNSPEYIASEVTRQLQSVVEENDFIKRNSADLTENPDTPGFPIAITKTFATQTYKPFNVASTLSLNFNTESDLNDFVNASTNLSDGWEYLKNYHIVACKRPELYETGRTINRTGLFGDISRTRGSTIAASTSGRHIDIEVSYDDKLLLDNFRDFILAQEKYPEVWKVFSDSRTPYNASDTIDNSRWMHINRYPNASMTHYTGSDAETIKQNSTLGWGGYKHFPWNDTIGAQKEPCGSVILPFQYDDSQKDKYYEFPDEKLNQRSYGCFGRSPAGRIRIFSTENNGIGSDLFTMLYNASNFLEIERKIGFDQHFTAPGVGYILPCDGFAGYDTDNNSSGSVYSRAEASNGYDGNATSYSEHLNIVNQLYLGATAPRLNFDGTHFTFSDLHTPINSGNSTRAGNPFETSYERQALTESDVVYVINPREQYIDLTPARKPYVLKAPNIPGSSNTQTELNYNLEPWRIYDSLTGIMIEDFNLTQNEWTNTLWDILGFSYKQFNSKKNTRLSFIGPNNKNDLSIIATNAEIDEGDTKIYKQNLYGTPLFKNMIALPGGFTDPNSTTAFRLYPEIKQKTESVKIVADNLPTRMIRGYYTIRSNMLQDSPFVGGKVNNTIMPIIGMVDKINGDGDFYFGQESSLQFTVTRPLRLASITCSLHDPDGSYARCSDQSAVLFKVQKNKRTTFNVAEELLQEQEKKKK